MMKVIVPHDIELLSCSVSETDAADGVVWSASATYAKDSKVRHNHVSYTSLIDGNKGNDPSKTWSGTDAKWKKLEATNPYRMLDEYVETQTKGVAGQNLTFCVKYDRADAFALLNLDGLSLRARVYDLDYSETEMVWPTEWDFYEDITQISLWEYIYRPLEDAWRLVRDISAFSLYEYNYSPIVGFDKFTRSGTSMPLNGKLCVEIKSSGAGHIPAVGHVVVGRMYEIGWTLYDAELGFLDYSRKNTDEFGRTSLVRRSFANTMSLPIYLHPNQSDAVRQILSTLRGTPTFWIGDNVDDGFAALSIYGWLEDYRMVYAGPNEMQLSLEIQGLI